MNYYTICDGMGVYKYMYVSLCVFPLQEYLEKMGFRNVSQDRDQWRVIVKEAKVHHGTAAPAEEVFLFLQIQISETQ
jgi:hypothetical protein